MDLGTQFVHDKRNFLTRQTEERCKLSIMRNQRSDCRSRRNAEKLTASSILIISEKIRRRLVLLKIRLVVQGPARSGKWLHESSIEL